MRFLIGFIFLLSICAHAQETPPDLVIKGTIDSINDVNVRPLRASLYSAVFPGAGQAYNKQYWKIPIVWATIGTSVGFVVYYNKQYNKFRNGYIKSLNNESTGFPTAYTTEILARAQADQRRDRDYALVFTTLFYAMNIIDAIVSAHLLPMKFDKDLAIHPTIIENPTSLSYSAGLGLHFKF